MANWEDQGFLSAEDQKIAEECLRCVRIARAVSRTRIRVRTLNQEPVQRVRSDMQSEDYSVSRAGDNIPAEEIAGHETEILMALLHVRLGRMNNRGEDLR